MTKKTYFTVSSIVFAGVAVLHLLRFLSGGELSIAGISIPPLASLFAAVAGGILSYYGCILMKKEK